MNRRLMLLYHEYEIYRIRLLRYCDFSSDFIIGLTVKPNWTDPESVIRTFTIDGAFISPSGFDNKATNMLFKLYVKAHEYAYTKVGKEKEFLLWKLSLRRIDQE
jgi:hypothetical protein